MRPFAHAAQAIERGNAHTGGKIAVRSATDGCFAELPVDLLRNLLSFLVQDSHACATLHRQAVDPAFHRQFATLVEGLQSAYLAIESRRLLRTLDAYIDFNRGLRCDDIRARSPANHARIDGQALFQIVELRDRGNLPGELHNGAVPLAGIESRMCRYSVHRQR